MINWSKNCTKSYINVLLSVCLTAETSQP